MKYKNDERLTQTTQFVRMMDVLLMLAAIQRETSAEVILELFIDLIMIFFSCR